MTKFKYIYENEIGVTCFDRYFEYLEDIKAYMPKNLRTFAINEGRYTLSGDLTLHDAWLKVVNVEKTYAEKIMDSKVKLVLLQATHRKEIWLGYGGASGFNCSLTPNHWPNQPVDLLAHEFTMLDTGLFKHAIQFDRDVWLEVIFSDFEITELERPYGGLTLR